MTPDVIDTPDSLDQRYGREARALVEQILGGLDRNEILRLQARPYVLEAAVHSALAALGTSNSSVDDIEIFGFKNKRRVESNATPEARLEALTVSVPTNDTLTSDEMAKRLGVSRPTVVAWRNEGKLIGWQGVRRGYRFPAEQLNRRGKPLPGLAEIVTLLDDHYSAWLWLTDTLASLEGRRPIDLLRKGQVEAVVRAAQGYEQGDFG